jgi:hypothetical protein
MRILLLSIAQVAQTDNPAAKLGRIAGCSLKDAMVRRGLKGWGENDGRKGVRKMGGE